MGATGAQEGALPATGLRPLLHHFLNLLAEEARAGPEEPHAQGAPGSEGSSHALVAAHPAGIACWSSASHGELLRQGNQGSGFTLCRTKGLCQGHPLCSHCRSSSSSEETQLFHIPRVTSLKL